MACLLHEGTNKQTKKPIYFKSGTWHGKNIYPTLHDFKEQAVIQNEALKFLFV